MPHKFNVGIVLPAHYHGGIAKLSTMAALDLAGAGHSVTIFIPLMPHYYYHVTLGKHPLTWLKASVRHLKYWARTRTFYFQDMLTGQEGSEFVSVNFVLRRASKAALKKFDYLILHSIAGVSEYKKHFPQERQIYLVHHPEEQDHGQSEVFRKLRSDFKGKILAVSPATTREIENHVPDPPLMPDSVSPLMWRQQHDLCRESERQDVLLFWKSPESGSTGTQIIRALLDLRPRTTVTIWCRVGYGYTEIAKGAFPEIPVVENVSEQELCDLYLGHSLLLFPSTHEGFGMPPIEALACGCIPVLRPGVGAAEMYARDSENSIFIEWNAEETASRMAAVLDDPAKLRAMRITGAESITPFDPVGYGHRILAAAGVLHSTPNPF